LSHSPATVAPEHEHDSPLQHHFADMEQQQQASSLGMWVFLGTEIMFFGGMFLAYLIYRMWYFNEFAIGSRSLDIWLGTINTVVLICSSLTVALGVKAAQTGRRKTLVVLLVLTLIFGCAFLGIKGVEWHQKYEEHHIPGTSFSIADLIQQYPQVPLDQQHAQLYFSLYFAMTGLHAVHMIIGVGIFVVLLVMAWKGRFGPEYYTPVEIGGLYWHFVDIVWIYLFPLLYLIDRKHIG
jgi:cytochrome c oxidase subunit 3